MGTGWGLGGSGTESLFFGDWGLGSGVDQEGVRGWGAGIGGFWLPALRRGLGGSPELNHRFCFVLKFENSCYFLQVFKKFTRLLLIAY